MDLIVNALLSCGLLTVLCGTIIVLTWNSRNRIEMIQIGKNGLIIQFSKIGKLRNK